ncbi:MAG: hypothetical protein ACREF5_01595 [Candidatus Saccharimonadales bacterium]
MAEDSPVPKRDPAAEAEADELSSLADQDDQLGKGYTSSSSNKPKPNLLSKLPGNLTKKWVLITGGSVAGIISLAVIGFFLLLPLKLVDIVTNLQNTFASTSEYALSKETNNLFSGYMSQVMRAYSAPGCHGSTLDATCVVTTSGSGPISKLYQAWKQQHLEQKLAKNYNIIIGKKGSQLYMTVGGETVASAEDLDQVANGTKSIFDLGGGVERMSTTEVRQAIDKALEGSTLWDKAYFRFKFGPLLESKYGVKLCVISCAYYDKFAYPVSQKLKSAEANVVMRVLEPLNGNFSLIMGCVISGGCQDETAAEDTTVGDTQEKVSGVQQQMQETLQSALADDPEALSGVVSQANDIMKNGFTATIAKTITEKVVTAVAGSDTGATAGEAAVPVVGWVLLVANIDHIASEIGPTLRVMSYAAEAAAAVSLWQTYNTVVSEMKSGHMDSTELGSFSKSLDTNLNQSSTNQSDATSTPLYSYLYDGGSTTSNSSYKCNNGQPVPSGQLVCPEEQLDRGNNVANELSDVTNIPILTPALGVINDLSNFVFGAIFTVVFKAFGLVCDVSPGCSQLASGGEQLAGAAVSWLVGHVISSPFSENMSGGRTFDMMAAGADVSNNNSCQVELGCQKLSNQQVATLRNQQLGGEKANFDSQSFFARIFSTSSPYSLVSIIALALPTTNPLTTFETGMADIIGNPLGSVASIFSDIFATDKAFAAVPARPDPFGVIQYGYPDSAIPPNPQQYWDDNCQGNYEQAWLNTQTIDTNNGQAVATTPNPCLLILSSIQGSGVMFDSSMAPAGSLNPDPSPGGQ